MAVKKNVIKLVLGKELSFEGAYHQISYLNGNKENMEIRVSVYDSGKSNLIEHKNYKFVPSFNDDSDNTIKQGYEYLKTLDEFSDAVDC